MEPATTIIKRFGGVREVVRITGLHRAWVWKWTQPRCKGGTSGRIPQTHQLIILKAARERGFKDITPELMIGIEAEK